MPKKRAPAFTQAKPTYIHPSLQRSTASASTSTSSPQAPQTVTQRIQHLRREQAPRSTPAQTDSLTFAVSTRTVPPDLRRILHIPEVNSPGPKPGTRIRRTVGGQRLPPGPAAPRSWVARTTPGRVERTRRDTGDKTPGFGLLARVTDGEFKRFPPPGSLVHCCLRVFAAKWNELAEFEQHYLPALPVGIREALLSYLTLYSELGSVDFRSFKILFQDDEAGGVDETRFLDLTGLLNENFTIGDLGKCLKRPAPHTTTLGFENLDISSTTQTPTAVSDSWEDEDEDDPPNVPPPPIPSAHLTTPHFTTLTRLSLAHPGLSASWPDLLKLAPHLNKLTHLSLAYWPRPSLTPNATTTSMVSHHTSTPLGGAHFYSDLDEDYHEAANVLRRLSLHTYSLQWLDLEGCPWLRALTWRNDTPLLGSFADESWLTTAGTAFLGPDWNDAWRRVEYLHVWQGWIPSHTPSLMIIPAGVVQVQLMRWLRECGSRESERWKVNGGEVGSRVAEWVDREKGARAVAREIQELRREGGGEWCSVDFGWGREGA